MVFIVKIANPPEVASRKTRFAGEFKLQFLGKFVHHRMPSFGIFRI